MSVAVYDADYYTVGDEELMGYFLSLLTCCLLLSAAQSVNGYSQGQYRQWAMKPEATAIGNSAR